MGTYKDLTGQKFGHLTVIKRDISRGMGTVYWLCQCDCGNPQLFSARSSRLISGETTHCGCSPVKPGSQIDKNSLVGQKFNRWTVLERDLEKKAQGIKAAYWVCQCDCGTIRSVAGSSLKNNKSKSCGCYHSEVTSTINSPIDITNKRFGKLVANYNTMQLDHSSKTYLWHCTCDCGNEKNVSVALLNAGHCQSCGQCGFKSAGEYKIATLLTMSNIKFVREYKFSELKAKQTLRFDFALLNEKDEVIRLIEFDGEQHYMDNIRLFDKRGDSLEQRQYRDNLKNEYAVKHNIPLVRVPYYDINIITTDSLLGDEYLI